LNLLPMVRGFLRILIIFYEKRLNFVAASPCLSYDK
jgi:hypothetical protein